MWTNEFYSIKTIFKQNAKLASFLNFYSFSDPREEETIKSILSREDKALPELVPAKISANMVFLWK